MMSQEQFHQFMVSNGYRNNTDFNQIPENQLRIIEYIKNMPINLESLNIVQNLMKQYSIQILLPLKYFYDKFQQQPELIGQYRQKIVRVGILAGCIIRPTICTQLAFLAIGGKANKKGGFMVREKNQEELKLMAILQKIRVLITKDNQKNFTQEDNQEVKHILQMANNGQYSVFSKLYVHQMVSTITSYEPQKYKLEQSTFQNSLEISGFQDHTKDSIKLNNTVLNITQSTENSSNQNDTSTYQNNISFQKSTQTGQILNKQASYSSFSQFYVYQMLQQSTQTVKNVQNNDKIQNQTKFTQIQKKNQDQSTFSVNISLQKQIVNNQKNKLQTTPQVKNTQYQQGKIGQNQQNLKYSKQYNQIDLNQKMQNQILQNKIMQNQILQNETLQNYKLNKIQQSLNAEQNLASIKKTISNQSIDKQSYIPHITMIKPLTEQSVKSFQQTFPEIKISKQYGPNYSHIPLCCRTFFFDQQRILQSQDRRIEFKSYRFPFSPTSFQTFKKTICSFLNTQGGDIYIGIKQTTNKKYRYILGNYLTQNDKQEVLKAFRRIAQNIYPNAINKLEVQFVPIRTSPFKDMSPITQMQVYSFDFTQKPLRLQLCPYRPARYLIRVRVQVGNRDQMYNYIQTEVSLVKNATTNDFVAIRSQNQVFSKRISQEVLQLYRQKLLYGPEQIKYAHTGPCQKPQIGNIRNEPQPAEDAQETKRIEQMILKNHETYFKKRIQGQKQKHQNEIAKQQKPSKAQQMDQNAKVEQNLQKLFQYPLTFIVTNISLQRFKRVIEKTPAKQYSIIQKCENSLTKQQLIIIKIGGYHYMQQFLRIKQKVEKHFAKDKVEFIGITKILLLQSNQNRKVAQHKIKTLNHKCGINNRTLSFYSLIDSASYLLFMKYMGYRIQVILD